MCLPRKYIFCLYVWDSKRRKWCCGTIIKWRSYSLLTICLCAHTTLLVLIQPMAVLAHIHTPACLQLSLICSLPFPSSSPYCYVLSTPEKPSEATSRAIICSRLAVGDRYDWCLFRDRRYSTIPPWVLVAGQEYHVHIHSQRVNTCLDASSE